MILNDKHKKQGGKGMEFVSIFTHIETTPISFWKQGS
jgi:hypothetical protein